MDAINRVIITELKTNSRINLGKLASLAGISRQSLSKRINNLERKGYILGYTIITPPEKINSEKYIQAFFRIKFKKGANCSSISHIFSSYKDIVASWAVTGNWDSILLIKAGSMERISEIREIISEMSLIDRIETEVVLNELRCNI